MNQHNWILILRWIEHWNYCSTHFHLNVSKHKSLLCIPWTRFQLKLIQSKTIFATVEPMHAEFVSTYRNWFQDLWYFRSSSLPLHKEKKVCYSNDFMIKHPGKNLLKPCGCTTCDTDLLIKKKIWIKLISESDRHLIKSIKMK